MWKLLGKVVATARKILARSLPNRVLGEAFAENEHQEWRNFAADASKKAR